MEHRQRITKGRFGDQCKSDSNILDPLQLKNSHIRCLYIPNRDRLRALHFEKFTDFTSTHLFIVEGWISALLRNGCATTSWFSKLAEPVLHCFRVLTFEFCARPPVRSWNKNLKILRLREKSQKRSDLSTYHTHSLKLPPDSMHIRTVSHCAQKTNMHCLTKKIVFD